MAAPLTLAQLRSKILKANKAYHDGDRPIMTDKEYDLLVDRLTELSPDDKVLKNVGYKPTKGRKVNLARPMGSLPKIKVGEKNLRDWVALNGRKTVIVSDKLDGVSLAYGNHVKNGYYLHTRGNGVIGTDVSHLIPYIKGLGDLPVNHEVRGELVITKSAFDKLKGEFKNARNLASGMVNKLGIHPNIRKSTFIVHEQTQPSKQLNIIAARLKSAGFFVVHHKVFKKPTVVALEEYLQTRFDLAKTDIDGVVLDNTKERVALKSVNEVVSVEVREVEWNVSRHGLLKPIVWFTKPVMLAGAKVSKATGHNAGFIKNGKIGPKAIVTLIRSGEVIPKITGVVKGSKASLPYVPYEWISDVEIRSTEDESDNQISLVMANFLSVLGIKSFKSNLMGKLVENNIDTVQKLIKASVSRLQGAGLGPKQSQQLYSEIRSRMSDTPHYIMAAACGIFPAGFGTRKMKLIFESTPDLLTTTKLEDKLSLVGGIGRLTAGEFVKHLPAYKKFIASVNFAPKMIKPKKGKLTGVSFAFTGFRDASAEAAITKQGGSVQGVTRSTTYLVAKPGAMSTKITKARDLGIKVITPAQLLKLI